MFGKILNVIDKILTFFEDWTLFLSVMARLLALFVNVILRYGFNYTLAWSEELVREVIILHHLHRLRRSGQKPLDDQDRRRASVGSQAEGPFDFLQQPGHH